MEEGDIIVDAGNALFTDTRRREAALRERGLHFVGTGVSGGEEGALNGPSIMPGGTKESYDRLGPMFETIAAKAEDGAPCCDRLEHGAETVVGLLDRKSTRLNSSHVAISYAVFCLKKKKKKID